MIHNRILIVEDTMEIRELYVDLFEKEGFEVAVCTNGSDAIEFLNTHEEPCLILLDMLMPIMNGKEFMIEFSKRPHTVVPIPVYLVSGTSDSSEAKKMGCCGFIKKPFDISALLFIAHTHCKSSKDK